MSEVSDSRAALTEALHRKGVTGHCPMCSANDWQIQDREAVSKLDIARTDITPEPLWSGYFPTYWIYCGNCGFVVHFMKSVLDEPTP